MNTGDAHDEPCELLPWDTEFFGLRIARVKRSSLTPELCAEIDRWCAAHRIRCVYANLASFGWFPSISVAEDAGFRLVDVKLTLAHTSKDYPAKRSPASAEIRPATRRDLLILESIAAKAHRDGRFARDVRFGPEKADELFRVWIRKSVLQSEAGGPDLDRQDHCLVAALDGVVCGYAALTITHNRNIGTISLLAVDESARRAGVGYALVHASLDYFATQEIPTITVVTQAYNEPAQRLYQRCGFVTAGCTFVCHKWYGPADGGGRG